MNNIRILTPYEQYWELQRRQQLMNAQLKYACRYWSGTTNFDIRQEIVDSLVPANDKCQAAFLKIKSYTDDDALSQMDPLKQMRNARLRGMPLPVKRPRFACSSMRSGNYQGRNFDWTFDYEPMFFIITLKTNTRHATFGVGNSMTMTWEDIKNIRDHKAYNKDFDKIIYFTVDGINDQGVCCNINVVPVGDDPRDPSNVKGNNYTLSTNPGKKRISIPQSVRYVLDYANSCEHAVELLRSLDLYATYGKMGEGSKKMDFAEEFHLMISDISKTAIVEFVGNKMVVSYHDRDNNWKCLQDGVPYDRLPIMTNFHVTNFDGDTSNIQMTDIWNKGEYNHTLTAHAMGTERYCNLYNAFSIIDSVDTMKEAMQNIKYTRGYNEESPFYTEFLDEYAIYGGKYPPLRLWSPKADFIGEDKVPTMMIRLFKDTQAISDPNERDHAIRTSKIPFWQSISTSVYDIENKSANVFIQEDYNTPFKFAYDKTTGEFKYIA